jgi:pimeloyl-ACP methyl ester carboxylesterase
VTLVSLARESLSWLRPSIWQEKKIYGILGILPAFGPFKRASYPIRLEDPSSHYVLQVAATIKAQSPSDRLDSISCPVLLIHGTADYLVNESNAIHIKKRVKKSELTLIKGATHYSTIFETIVPEKIATFIKKNIR